MLHHFVLTRGSLLPIATTNYSIVVHTFRRCGKFLGERRNPAGSADTYNRRLQSGLRNMTKKKEDELDCACVTNLFFDEAVGTCRHRDGGEKADSDRHCARCNSSSGESALMSTFGRKHELRLAAKISTVLLCHSGC